jgi:hypothetical protein
MDLGRFPHLPGEKLPTLLAMIEVMHSNLGFSALNSNDQTFWRNARIFYPDGSK